MYGQLHRAEHFSVPQPLPPEDDDEFDDYVQPYRGTWRRCGWGGGDMYDSYYVRDKGRSHGDYEVALGVNIEKRALDYVEDGEEYQTDEEDEDAMDSDGSEYEDEDSDGEDEVPEEGRASAGIIGAQASAA